MREGIKNPLASLDVGFLAGLLTEGLAALMEPDFALETVQCLVQAGHFFPAAACGDHLHAEVGVPAGLISAFVSCGRERTPSYRCVSERCRRKTTCTDFHSDDDGDDYNWPGT